MMFKTALSPFSFSYPRKMILAVKRAQLMMFDIPQVGFKETGNQSWQGA